jgi:hypothetical protein
MKKSGSTSEQSAVEQIDKRIAELGDWRGKTLARMRKLIKQADPDVVEEWKWAKASSPGTPVWSHDGIICTGESYKSIVKFTFAKGAALADPAGLFNASLEGNARRAIDIHEGETVNAGAFKTLIRAAVALNKSGGKPVTAKAKTSKKSAKVRRTSPTSAGGKPKLLSGGNPQIAKAEGDAPVQAYIAAIPGWKRDVARRIDALVVRTVPAVRKAVKWNSPFYGMDGQGWFLSFHVFTHYVKVTFFKGTSLRPVPPGGASKEARWIDVHEDDLDEKQLAAWIKQAASIAGWAT